MERKEFKQRLKGLFAWMLVMILVVNGTQGGLVTAYAEGTEGTMGTEGSTETEGSTGTENTFNLPVNYYDEIWDTEDLMTTTKPEDGGAWITTTDYTKEVNVANEATVITDVVLPTVKKDGFVFVNWELGISGKYNETTHEVELGDGWTAEGLDELPFIAIFQDALISDIYYDFNGGTVNGEEFYSYTITQPDINPEFEEPVLTAIPVQKGMIFTGWQQIEATDMTWYDADEGIIHGVYGEPVSLIADWREEYTVTVNYIVQEADSDKGELGSDIVPVTFNESETAEPSITLPAPTPFEGYAFAGWMCVDVSTKEYREDLPGYDTQLGTYPTGAVFKPGYMVDESTGNINQEYIMYASFKTAESLMVSYDLNGGQGLESIEEVVYQKDVIETSATFTLPEAPSYEGYEFAGWLCSADGNTYKAGTEVSVPFSDVSVSFQALWERELAITYDAAGGTIISTDYTETVRVASEDSSVDIVTLPIAEREGYFFVNWQLGVNGGGSYLGGTHTISWDGSVAKNNLTELPFTANWQEVKVSTITYEFAGAIMNGSADSYVVTLRQPGMENETFEEAVVTFEPTKEGYIFTGWELQKTDTGSGSYNVTDTGAVVSGNYGENYTLVAQWRAENTIEITAVAASGFENAGTIEAGMNGTRGESTDNDGNGNYLLTLPEVKDIAEGYFFLGWKLYEEQEAGLVEYTSGENYGDLYGTGILGYPVGASVAIPYPTLPNDGGNKVSYIMEAQFLNAEVIQVTYDVNGGIGLDVTTEIKYQNTMDETEVSIILPDAPTKVGYEFVGWLNSVDNGMYEAGDTVICEFAEVEAVTFTAQWEEKVYTVKIVYNTGDGTITSTDYTQEVELLAFATSAEAVVLPEVEKEYCFFEGWSLNVAPYNTYESGIQYLAWDENTPAHTLTELYLTANWKGKLEMSIVYGLNGGSLNGSTEAITERYWQQSVDDDVCVVEVLEGTPVMDGYVFDYWKFNTNDEDSSYENGMITGHYGIGYSMEAIWRQERVVNVNYTLPGEYEDAGEIVGDKTLAFYEGKMDGPVTVTLPQMTNVPKEYFFLGWKCFDDTGVEYKPDTDNYVNGKGYPAGTTLEMDYVELDANVHTINYRFVAQFVEAESVQVTQIVNGEYTISDVYQSSVDEESFELVLPEAPVREGYTFTGWLSSIDSKVYEAGTVIECSFDISIVTITAQWKENEYTIPITYDVDGGVIISTDYTQEVTLLATATDASVVVLPEVEKEGYIFCGWLLENSDDAAYEAGEQTLSWSADAPAYTLSSLILTAQWEKVLEAGTHTLKAGERYRFAEGKWTVDGDTTVYVGGCYFYVPEDGEYTLTKK